MAHVELAEWPKENHQVAVSLNELSTAEVLLLRALQFDPSNEAAHYRLGLIAMRRLHYDAAVDHLEKAYGINGDHRGIWRSLGSSYIWSGGLDRIFATEADRNPGEPEGQEQLFAQWLTAERDASDWLWMAYEAIKGDRDGLALALLQRQPLGGKGLAQRIVDAAHEVPDGFLRDAQSWTGAGPVKIVG